MRKITNILAGLAAFGVCGFMMWMSWDAGKETLIYNGAFLAVMLLILLSAIFIGFIRNCWVKKDLRRAAQQLKEINDGKMCIRTLPGNDEKFFTLPFLKSRFAEYEAIAKKTSWNTEISEYINEDVIDIYTGQKILDIVPDVLTSLGILGTFIGLVWGLKGFDPVSYEAMASSITSLVDGIKVAFITSIMGISLSLAFSFWLRKEETSVSEALEKFYDQFYLNNASNKKNDVLDSLVAGQKEQTETLREMAGEVPESTAQAVSDSIAPAMSQMNDTLDRFINVATLNQQEIVDTVSSNVTKSMMRSFNLELKELGNALGDTNSAQRENIRIMNEASAEYRNAMSEASKTILAAAKEDKARRKEVSAEYKAQQECLSEFVKNVNSALEHISDTTYEDLNTRMAMQKQVEAAQKVAEQMEESVLEMKREMVGFSKTIQNNSSQNITVESPEVKELTERMDKLAGILEEMAKNKKKGFFR